MKVVTVLDNLAYIYETMGFWDRAESFYRKSLFVRERIFGPNHLDIAKTLDALAKIYKVKRLPKNVESLYQRSLSIRENSLGPFHPEVAASLKNLADWYRHMGKLPQAVFLSRRATKIISKSNN